MTITEQPLERIHWVSSYTSKKCGGCGHYTSIRKNEADPRPLGFARAQVEADGSRVYTQRRPPGTQRGHFEFGMNGPCHTAVKTGRWVDVEGSWNAQAGRPFRTEEHVACPCPMWIPTVETCVDCDAEMPNVHPPRDHPELSGSLMCPKCAKAEGLPTAADDL